MLQSSERRIEWNMTKLSRIHVFVLVTVTVVFGQGAKSPSPDKLPYPNELPILRIYHDAKWKGIEPYISTKDDVDRLLGKPVLVYDDMLRANVSGYDCDPDWRIVVSYIAKGGDLPDSLVD